MAHMAPHANTFGPLLMVLMHRQLTLAACTCPCVNGSTNDNNIPPFVAQNYFCETGITQWNGSNIFWPDGDPLWDGQGCGPTSSCCTFNSPPWFNVQLSSPTTDDIEVRICSDQGNTIDDTHGILCEVNWT